LPQISFRPVPPRPFLIGLTGGIGAGKSMAAVRFVALSIPVIDTDEIAHALTAPSGGAMNAIRNTFGPQMLDRDGSLNRAAMRALVFTDAQAKVKLESILHPLIRRECLARIEGAMTAERETPPPYILLAVPLLFEAMSFRALISRSLLVDCPVSMQIERVARRPGMSAAEAARIVAAQIARPLRLQLADDVLVNSGEPNAIEVPIRALDALYRSLAMGGGRA
jgi:dephospho-CoA kinase